MSVFQVRLLSSDSISIGACACLHNHPTYRIVKVDSMRELLPEDRDSLAVLSLPTANNAPDKLGVTTPLLLLVDEQEQEVPPVITSRPLCAILGTRPGKLVLQKTLQSLARHASSHTEIETLSKRIRSAQKELDKFNRIGMALGSERDTERLFDLILQYARQITDADGGSIYIIREKTDGDGKTKKILYFANTQSETLSIPSKKMEMEISEQSISGHVALHGDIVNLPDVYNLPPDSVFRYNPSFDRKMNYRAKSMLTLPMRNQEDEVIGVLQLINKKKNPGVPLRPIEVVEKEVIPFTKRDEQRALALGGQAAVALENRILYEEIEQLFEGFIRASVNAIEARDPVTSGHTERVTQLTLALAQAVNDITEGLYADTVFTSDQMRELRYAGLLHDIGKIGVREDVLTKANKLYPGEYAVLLHRFENIRLSLCSEQSQVMLKNALGEGSEIYQEFEERYKNQLKVQIEEIDSIWELIEAFNQPKVLPEEASDLLPKIAQRTYRNAKGEEQRFLTDHELHCLSVKKGSLTPEEIEEIRSHIIHTRNFLERIPWTRNLMGLTDIASGHHEMLNGTGYPQHLEGKEVVTQMRIMAIADIFDALTASDRPYKKAVPVDRALRILEFEVKDNRLDAELVRIFKEQKVYETLPAFANERSNQTT